MNKGVLTPKQIKRRQKHVKYYSANSQSEIARVIEYRRANPEIHRKAYLKYQRSHPWMMMANVQLRRARKLLATPKWLTSEMKRDIVFFYRIRSEMVSPKLWQVDHIWPLKGKLSNGLHVPWNLRLIPATINRKKWNKEPQAE